MENINFFKEEIQNLKRVNVLSHQVLKVEENLNINNFVNIKNIFQNDCYFDESNLQKGQYVVYKPKNYKIHIVRPNQTLEDISNIYNISTAEILKRNNIQVIFTGLQLKI